MTRHTFSPIWCVVLFVISSCGDEAGQVHSAASAEPSKTKVAKVVAKPKAPVVSQSAVKAAALPEKSGKAEVKKAPASSRKEKKQASVSKDVSKADVARALGAGGPPRTPIIRASAGRSVTVAEAVHGSALAPSPTAHDVNEPEDKGPLHLIAGFSEPTAVVYDAEADIYLVSNMNRIGEQTPGKGYISRVNPKGEIESSRWIDGAEKRAKLVAPRGLAIIGSRLYVTDGDMIRVYDRQSGVRRGGIRVEGATRLNGLGPGPSGALFVADSGYTDGHTPSGTDAVYRVNRAGRASAIFRSPVLGHPSSAAFLGRVTWISTLGSGKLYGIKSDGRLLSGPRIEDGRLSGILVIGKNDVVVTSHGAQGVYRGSPNGHFEFIRSGIMFPGHPAWDPSRRRVLVPSLTTGNVHVLTFPAKEKGKKRRG